MSKLSVLISSHSQLFQLQRIREIPPDLETLLIKSKQNFPVTKTEWNIPESVLNPVREPPQPGDEHFYSSKSLFVKIISWSLMSIYSI